MVVRMPSDDRLAELEHTLVRLTRELADARREFAQLRESHAKDGGTTQAPTGQQHTDQLRAEPRRAAQPGPAPRVGDPPSRMERPRARPAPDTRASAEQLIGRYGTLSVGVLMIVLAASALVSWAVRHGMLGPWVRIALGALLAVVFAVVGLRVRQRARAFSNALLALSLAVTHVVAWGAGPKLGLVPSWVSLLVASVASLSLGYLALREGEERLLALGLGGALLAPFVMGDGTPHFVVLALYGFTLLATTVRVTGENAWWYVTLIVLVYTPAYAGALTSTRIEPAWLQRNLSEMFAAATALAALRWSRPPTRPWVAVMSLLVMSVALWSGVPSLRAPGTFETLRAAPEIVPIAVAGAVLALYAVRDVDARWFGRWLAPAVLLPSLFIGPVIAILWREADAVNGVAVAVWAALYAGAARFERANRRIALWSTSGTVALIALLLILNNLPDVMPFVIAAYAVVFARAMRREGFVPALIVSSLSIVYAYTESVSRLAEYSGFVTPPFVSLASAHVASTVVAAWLAVMLGAPRDANSNAPIAIARRAAWGAAGVLAFVWGHVELSQAFSSDASSFLLIFYYAVCGVGVIGLGRTRSEGTLRHVGLVLSLAAAAMAFVRAVGISNVGLRVGSYLAAGVFLLGVAWLYRETTKGKGDN